MPSKLIQSATKRLLLMQRPEMSITLLSTLLHLLLLGSYYILRPVRDEIGSEHSDHLPQLWLAVFFVMLVVIPLYTVVAGRVRRARLLPIVYGFLLLNLFVFAALLGNVGGTASQWIEWSFYVWSSMYPLLVVSTFWAYMVDVFGSEQSTRLFGPIAVGGSLGGILGPMTAALLVTHTGRISLLFIAAAVLACAIPVIVLIQRHVLHQQQAQPAASDMDQNYHIAGTTTTRIDRTHQPTLRSFWYDLIAGIVQISRSRYLLAIAGFIGMMSLGSTFLYYEKAALAEVAFEHRPRRTAFFASVDLLVNITTALLQLLAVSRLVRRIGLGWTLATVPATNIIGFVVLGVTLLITLPAINGEAGGSPLVMVFTILVIFEMMQRGVRYAFGKPSREMLYTVLPRREKYQGKVALDTIVYRGSDVVNGFLFSGLIAIGISLGGVLLAAVPSFLIAILLSRYLGRKAAGKRE